MTAPRIQKLLQLRWLPIFLPYVTDEINQHKKTGPYSVREIAGSKLGFTELVMKAAESIFMNQHVAKKFKDEKWSIQLILMQTLKNTGGKPGLAWEHT